MPIGVDATTLMVGAAASAHAFEQAITHVNEEIAARDPEKLDPLVNTLAPEGPYAYTILPQVSADGAVRLPVLSTRDEIREAYAFIRGLSDLLEVTGLTEVRGSWYLFQDNMTRGRLKGDTTVNINQTVSIFPSGSGSGITGELVWRRVPRSTLGAPDEVDVALDDPLMARRQVHDQYQHYLAGLQANDVDQVLETIHPGGASAIRDFVADTGHLIELTGHDEHRAWWESYFATYEVVSVQPLVQVTEDWYTFTEQRITVERRDGGGMRTYNTAQFHIPAKDGRFIANVGHGTEPA